MKSTVIAHIIVALAFVGLCVAWFTGINTSNWPENYSGWE